MPGFFPAKIIDPPNSWRALSEVIDVPAAKPYGQGSAAARRIAHQQRG